MINENLAISTQLPPPLSHSSHYKEVLANIFFFLKNIYLFIFDCAGPLLLKLL